jgi:hypothetical protein
MPSAKGSSTSTARPVPDEQITCRSSASYMACVFRTA